MKISNAKLNLLLAQKCMQKKDLKEAVSKTTLSKIAKGEKISPFIVGKIARALNVDVEEIIEQEV